MIFLSGLISIFRSHNAFQFEVFYQPTIGHQRLCEKKTTSNNNRPFVSYLMCEFCFEILKKNETSTFDFESWFIFFSFFHSYFYRVQRFFFLLHLFVHSVVRMHPIVNDCFLSSILLLPPSCFICTFTDNLMLCANQLQSYFFLNIFRSCLLHINSVLFFLTLTLGIENCT